MTNQEKFIQTFGVDAWDAWKEMAEFSGVAEQFKEYWTSPHYSGNNIACEGDTVCHCNLKENAQLIAEILDEDSLGEVYTPHQKYELEILQHCIDTKLSEISKCIDGFINRQVEPQESEKIDADSN